MKRWMLIIWLVVWALSTTAYAGPDTGTYFSSGNTNAPPVSDAYGLVVRPIAGSHVSTITIASGVTTNTTTTPVPGVTGSKTIWLELSGTGAVSVDITVYGARVSAPTSNELEVVCTYAGLSGTTKKIGTCNGVMTAAYPYLAIKTENISGTGASVTAYVFY